MSITSNYYRVVSDSATDDPIYVYDITTNNGPWHDDINDILWYDYKDLKFNEIYCPQIPLCITKTNVVPREDRRLQGKVKFEQGQLMVEWGDNVKEVLEEWSEEVKKAVNERLQYWRNETRKEMEEKHKCDIDLSMLDDI